MLNTYLDTNEFTSIQLYFEVHITKFMLNGIASYIFILKSFTIIPENKNV